MDIKVNQNTVIVFDLDDTLYNEIDYLRSAYTDLAKELQPNNWERLFSFLFSMYRNNKNVFEYLSEHYEITMEELIKQYRNHIPKIKPFAGVLESFEKIKARNGKIAILTDGRKIAQGNKIKALGLLEYVDYIVISEELGSEKPDENNFKSVEQKFQCSTYYYIGDNFKKDFISPNKLGWQTVALIDNGLNIHSNAQAYDKPAYLPHHFITLFSELNFV